MIGKQVKPWQAAAYHNNEEVQLNSKDYEGNWQVIYFYPLDFTFICPTEIRGFEALQEEFKREGAAVIGVSTDSFFSHQAWFNDGQTFKQGVTHPVIADTSHAISKLFKVLNKKQGVAYRATVIIDDEGIIRSYAVNDLNAGRSPAETLRVLQALKSGGLCGADWHQGEAFAA